MNTGTVGINYGDTTVTAPAPRPAQLPDGVQMNAPAPSNSSLHIGLWLFLAVGIVGAVAAALADPRRR